ncbi:MarR family winged helix-turn-helix transcriptional regulator [Ancylobacter sp. G4_0304]|uniref:MarR family winged helix-turn-helix transcriptional regulator n=1 Tax=Ancylobacter sp. G4_0304 TaxID=3114289 RepID=UPI0039C715EF
MDKPTGQHRPLTTSRPALLQDNGDNEFRQMVSELVDFSGRLQEIRAAVARAMHLTPPQYNIIMSLAQADDQMTVSDLAERLRVSVPFIVTETRRLEEVGMLEKRADLADRRRVNLYLTEKAWEALRDVASVQVCVNDVLFETLGVREMRLLTRLIRGLLDSCDIALERAQSRPSEVAREI